MAERTQSIGFIDKSMIITESLVRAGADVFVGYPITPANLLYSYSSKRFPSFFAAPDEITTVQLMAGFAACGKIPVTATSFPGFALMIESINMAYMMELPMVIILVQRLGPATGTATCGAQGDVVLASNIISGGMAIPVFSVSDTTDNWKISAKSVELAVKLRTPVILLTSKEEVMTQFSFDMKQLEEIIPLKRSFYENDAPFRSYAADKMLVPEFLPLNNTKHQVRFTASTHDSNGDIQNTTKEALGNTERLHLKVKEHMKDYTYFELNECQDADTIVVSYGITSQASKVAVAELRSEGLKVSLLIAKTLFPVPLEYVQILDKYKRIIFAEENLDGQYRQVIYGFGHNKNVTGVNKIGKMIDPSEIKARVKEQLLSLQ